MELGECGQSFWLDYVRRDLIVSGELRRSIEENGLRGMTSNHSIFEKAIVGSREYDAYPQTGLLMKRQSGDL
jgi:transaldolase